MIKTQEKFKIRMLDDTLTAVKNDILNDRLSLPYSFDQKIDSSSFNLVGIPSSKVTV